MIRKVLVLAVAGVALLSSPRANAAYHFVEGYNVLDTNNAPSVGTNFAGTSGFERDIAVDAARGIIYIARGQQTTTDGRAGAPVGIAAIVVTNDARVGSNFRDTGLITPVNGWCQSLAYDPDGDRLWVLGGGISASPIIYSAPGGTLGGAPNGDAPSAANAAFVQAFRVDTNLLETGVYVSPQVTTNGILQRGGQPRGFAVRTVNGVTTVYLGMGNHVEAWSNDQIPQGTNAWRRIWATVRPPAAGLTSSRVAVAFSGINGVAVDDAGNCYFSVQTTGGRIWTARPEFIQGASDPMSLDFNDVVFGGSSEREVMGLVYSASAGATIITPPQAITFARFGTQKSLFVSFLPGAAQRAVTRLDVNDGLSISNSGFYLPARAVDGFGSGQPAAGQDTILSTMRLKQTNAAPQVTQPFGGSNGTLYHDVDSVTNPTFIYFQGFVIDTNKGQTIATATTGKVRIQSDTNPPSIATQPANQTLLEGGTITLTVSAAGMLPLSFQWQSNSVDIPGANSAIYSSTPASTNQSGLYSVIVSNALGSISSTTAVVTVNPLVRSEAMTAPSWSLAPGSRTYLTADNTQRGLAYNAATASLLLASRTPSNAVHVLDPETGDHRFTLGNNPSIITPSPAVTLALNMVGASDDGQVFAANLAQNAEPFRIYRWPSEEVDAPPENVFSAAANSLGAARHGDSFDVRGNAFDNSLQIIAGSRAGKSVVIFTTANGGATLISNVVQVPAAVNGSFGLSVSFAGPDTFWGKGDQATGLRLVQFDLANGTGAVLRVYGQSTYALSGTIMAVNTNLNVLAAISIENPDNLRLYDISDLGSGPRLVDQELFARDNDNGNATGAIDFGGGKVYALDSNNGIIAYTLGAIPPPPVVPRITITRTGNDVTLTWPGSFVLQSTMSLPGGTNFTDVTNATSGYSESVNSATQKYFRLRN